MNSVDERVEEIFLLYKKYGAGEYAGEKVSQLEHMSQAGYLAMREGFDQEVILAAFLHDIGHLLPVANENDSMDGFGVTQHEARAANFLREKGFSERVCKLVNAHVSAKRYLIWKNRGYLDRLSEASKVTLTYQGGPMNDEEAEAFEQDELFPLYLLMRKWDDAAKIEHEPLIELRIFRDMTRNHLNYVKLTTL